MSAESAGPDAPFFSSLSAHARRATLTVLSAGLRRSGVDIVFILVIAGLYAASHWIAWAISRLGSDS
jgi:hypothetical protein